MVVFFILDFVQDLNSALDVLESTLKENIKDLNSFDKYKQELHSGRLDWTPVHKDPVFWKENCKKFEDNDYEVRIVNLYDRSQGRLNYCFRLSSYWNTEGAFHRYFLKLPSHIL